MGTELWYKLYENRRHIIRPSLDHVYCPDGWEDKNYRNIQEVSTGIYQYRELKKIVRDPTTTQYSRNVLLKIMDEMRLEVVLFIIILFAFILINNAPVAKLKNQKVSDQKTSDIHTQIHI